MEKFIVTTGKTIDLAVTAALQQLGMDRDSVSVEVLENAKSGFLGIGASPAKVKVTYEVPDEPKKPEAPMSVLSSASRSKPKERPGITSSIISRPGKKIEPEEQQPARRERRPRQERRKPQNAEAPKQQEKPAKEHYQIWRAARKYKAKHCHNRKGHGYNKMYQPFVLIKAYSGSHVLHKLPPVGFL